MLHKNTIGKEYFKHLDPFWHSMNLKNDVTSVLRVQTEWQGQNTQELRLLLTRSLTYIQNMYWIDKP